MSSAELDDLAKSVDAALRRAYALGRQDALEQITTYLRSKETEAQPLALPAPANNPPPSNGEPQAEPAAAGGDSAQGEAAESRGDRGRVVSLRRDDPGMASSRPAPGNFVGTIRDFVYPPRAS